MWVWPSAEVGVESLSWGRVPQATVRKALAFGWKRKLNTRQMQAKPVHDVQGGPLFDLKIRFSLRTVLYAVSGACFLLTVYRLTGAIEDVVVVFCLGVAAFAIWSATRDTPRHLGNLIACHLVLAVWLLAGPVLSYHINGRAWYDYGLSQWDPPPYHLNDGSVVVSDYDPKSTRPAVWPIIGPIMYTLCWFSMCLMVLPPTAPIVSIALFALAIRLRHVPDWTAETDRVDKLGIWCHSGALSAGVGQMGSCVDCRLTDLQSGPGDCRSHWG